MKKQSSASSRFFPKKSFGQNFLIDNRIRDKIIQACDLNENDIVLEIGPGKGVLTGEISRRVKQVFAVEKDRHLAAALKEKFSGANIDVITEDILQYPFSHLPDRVKIVGNLPYNIATPIIEKVLKFRTKFTVFYMTVQMEHGLRLAAEPGTKDYGSLSCFVQYYADVKKLFKIRSTAFRPAPKVQSCFLRLDIHKHPKFDVCDEELLFRVIRASFSQRRKTIRNSLASVIGTEKLVPLLLVLQIDPRQRAENLSLKDYVRLANKLAEGIPK